MKTRTDKQIDSLRKRVGKRNWSEGLEHLEVWTLKFSFQTPIKYYWPNAKSYIIHRHGYKRWYCVTKDYYDKLGRTVTLVG